MKSTTCIGSNFCCRSCPSMRSTYPIKLNDKLLFLPLSKAWTLVLWPFASMAPFGGFKLNKWLHHYDGIGRSKYEHHAVGTGNDSLHLGGPESALLLLQHCWRPR